jgi:hypothetical protein
VASVKDAGRSLRVSEMTDSPVTDPRETLGFSPLRVSSLRYSVDTDEAKR